MFKMEALFICTLLATIGLSDCRFFGAVNPHYAVFVGRHFTLECNVVYNHTDTPTALGQKPNSLLYFVVVNHNNDRQVIDLNFNEQAPIYYSLLNDNAIQLHIKHLSLKHRGMFECYVNNSQTGGRDTWIGSAYIDVGDVPDIFETITVLGNFETMRVSWCMKEDDPSISTLRWAHIAEFNQISNDVISVGDYRECPFWLNSCTCDFNGSTLIPYSHYNLHIVKFNLYSHEYLVKGKYYVDHKLVQLRPIQFTNNIVRTNVSVCVSWKPIMVYGPNNNQTGVQILYTFNLYSEWGNMMAVETFISSGNQKTFKGLNPNTVYTIEATCSVVGSSYTSQKKRIKVWTSD